ncbi:hypothetical protein Tco_0006903 [Tanacetum coccineum]
MCVPIIGFSEDGLSAIATKLGTHLMLDSYTSIMCIESWGWSSYVRAMIELRAKAELKDSIVVAIPKIEGEGLNPCLDDFENIKTQKQKLFVSSLGLKFSIGNMVDVDEERCSRTPSAQEASQVEGNQRKDKQTNVPSSNACNQPPNVKKEVNLKSENMPSTSVMASKKVDEVVFED